MRWTVRAALVGFLLVVACLSAAPARADVRVSVMFDFGTGRAYWADVPVPEGSTAWNATTVAADAFGFALDVSWSSYGVFVTGIDGVYGNLLDYWHLLRYESGGWNTTKVGAAGLEVASGDALGWYLSRDDPSWDYTSAWPGPRPLASPRDRHPVTTFRYDAVGGGLAPGIGPTRPVLAWTYNTTAFEVSATPAVAGGVVYLPTWTGFVAVSEANGARLWRNGAVAGASSPALHGDRIYVGGKDGRLHVLSMDDGTELWNLTLQANPVFSGITGSPRVAYGKVYVGTFNESGGDGGFYAVDVFSKEIAWSRPVSSVHYSSAAVWNGTVYVGLMGHFHPESLTYDPAYGLLALDAETGDEEWFVATNGSVASSPVIAADTVFVTSKAGELFAVDLDGAIGWKAAIHPTVSSPAVSENVLVVGDGLLGAPGTLRAFALWGEPLWTREMTGPVSSSPTIAGGLVYAATNEAEGRLAAVRLTDGDIVWTEVLVPTEYVLSSPVVHDGVVYIASDNGVLYAYSEGAVVDGFTPSWIPLAVGGGAVAVVVAVVAFAVLRGRGRRGP